MAPAPTGTEQGASERANPVRVRLWPVLITLGLVLVVLVNAVFIYIAVSGADDVVPSYRTEQR